MTKTVSQTLLAFRRSMDCYTQIMNSLRVLVAEDEPLARERLVRLLREGGCEILAELEDGASLVAWMVEHLDMHIDALFLDIQMPGITGLEALAELKNPPLTVLNEAATRQGDQRPSSLVA